MSMFPELGPAGVPRQRPNFRNLALFLFSTDFDVLYTIQF
jgi:hypothetical protein